MSTDTGTLFLALLTVGAQLSIVSLLIPSVRAAISDQALMLALLVALTATVGSLWLSEGAHFIPCKLCWYQRAGMYPLVPILAVAAVRRDISVRPYVLAVIALALPISIYHYLLERFPSIETGACDATNPCSVVWLWRFHYISIPLMAATAFALIAGLLLIAPKPTTKGS